MRRFLALGDSYTIGEGVEPSEGWPVRLADALRGQGLALADPRIIARTGWTTAELLAAIDSAEPPLSRDFDLVSLLIGVNDQYRGYGVDVFRRGFEQLLARAVKLGADDPTRVIVVSIPDWGVTPFAATDPRGASSIAAAIDQFNRVAQAEAERVGTAFVDVTTDSRRAAHDRSLLADDQLHPSSAMHRSWVDLTRAAATRALVA